MDKQPDQRSDVANRLLDEGVALVTKAASDVGISICAKTAIRWCLSGVRGIRLESLKIGGRRMTSRSAMRRFIAAIQDRPAQARATQPTSTPNSPLIMSIEESDRVLAAHGLARQPRA